MRKNPLLTSYKFYAAANGYSGFRSYFGRIFNPKDYLKIYILKGGPGTGKSSLLHSISRHFSEIEVYNEAIFCSSDPNSLDGVIVEKEGKKIAVIDGTAPHEQDAVFPGAVEEIINLGENWDSEMLESRREEIISINLDKKKAYKDAYEHLMLISNINTKIKAEFNNIADMNKIEKAADDFFDENLSSVGCSGESVRLTSSFGKDGYLHLDTLEKTAEKTYRISGGSEGRFAFMNALYRTAKKRGAAMLKAPSPFSDEDIEELYFPENKITVSINSLKGEIIDAGIAESAHLYSPSYEYLSSVRRELLEFARASFANASEAHFKLEKLYLPAMDFEKNEKITEMIIEKIRKKLSI